VTGRLPRSFGGIRADGRRAEHRAELDEHGIPAIDLVVVNLYPFAAAAAAVDASVEEAIEMIDIGGPGMVRAAAKNFANVAVVVDPSDYSAVLAMLEADGGVSGDMRRGLALKAFRHTRDYDDSIAAWLASGQPPSPGDDRAALPARVQIELERELAPRYGENPHQAAAVYRQVGKGGVLGGFRQLQGKGLSFNNLQDADAARRLTALFGVSGPEPTVEEPAAECAPRLN